MKCRHCKGTSFLPFIDLGAAPPSNAYLSKEDLKGPEKFYPLRVCVCDQCWLTQTEDFANSEELFDENYAYFSSTSTSWLKHAEKYVSDMVERFHLDSQSHVVEVASNDGYLLQYIQKAGIPCTGIEPTASTANEAMKKGIIVISEFFGESLGLRMAKDGKKADLTIANNVLAHVPDINDFVAGFSQLLKDDGVSTFEFPHLVRLVEENQFDTIYHEHFSYISLTAATKIFMANGLTIFDVEELTTHGGSLRIYAQKSKTGIHRITNRLTTLLMLEEKIGVNSALYYSKLQKNCEKIKNNFQRFLLKANQDGHKTIAYGAAAKGNTLINYAGIRPDLIEYVVDLAPSKQGKFMPGSRIPILTEDNIRLSKPNYVVILPWNLRAEIETQLYYIKEWGGKFVTAIPEIEIR